MADTTYLGTITQFYLTSRDFNGIPFRELAKGQDPAVIKALLAELIRQGLVAPVFGDRHPNPHIRALPEHHTPEKQIELLDGEQGGDACLYPLPKHLEAVVDRSQYEGRPYALELALGTPQLTHRSFDLAVLETYRNDPRYHYNSDDIFGSLSVKTDSGLPEAYEAFLQQFGFAYDDALNKYVAVFVRDLAGLSPDHQRLWKMREVTQPTDLHPDFHRASMGEWPERVSIYQAFVEELQVANEMAVAMGRPPVFRQDFKDKSRPREFASLLRPTAREYGQFVHLLDKLMSENINKKFFQGDVPDHDRESHLDGTFERRPRGTIRMLDEWVRQKFRTRDPSPLDEMIAAFREVRKLRQSPAHSTSEDQFDQTFVHQQRELMVKAYSAVRTVRLILANHPASKTVEVPDWLYKGAIWSR